MEYLPVRINTLRPDSQLTFDIYIPVGQRYVHYMRKTDEVDGDRLKNLKSKKIRKVFITEDCEADYLDYLDQGLNDLIENDVPLEEKTVAIHDGLTTSAENAERSLETEEGYKRMEVQFQKVTDFLMSEKGAIKKILESTGQSLDNFQHAATVTSLSLGVAAANGMDSKDILELGIAALLHDIGKTKLPFDPMKPVSEMNETEKNRYKQHSSDGADILAGKPFVSPRILALVADHEEVGNKRGYPQKKNLFGLGMQFQILNMCNDFDRFCYENKLEHRDGLDTFFDKRGELFDPDLFNHLVTLLN